MDVLAVLEKFGIRYEYTGAENELKLLCPFHDDKNPSLFLNVDKLKFKCHVAGCGAKGSFVSLLARHANTQPAVIRELLERDFGYAPEEKTTPVEVIEKYHAKLHNAGPLLAELRKRGVDADLIRQYRLGEDKGKITIPIKSASGQYVHVKRYSPGQKGDKKFRNQKYRGQNRVYPVDQLSYEKIVYCGGELKAIVAAKQLNPQGIGALSCTAGEGNHDAKTLAVLKGKTVYVCMDVDEPGQQGAQIACRVLYRIAAWVGNLLLPLDVSQYPSGDINDFIAAENGDVYKLLADVPQWKPTKRQLVLEPPEPMQLRDAIHAKNINRRVQLKAFVSQVDQTSYAIPKTLAVDCDRSQNECQACPVYLQEIGAEYTIHPESSAILAMVDNVKSKQREHIMDALEVPATCKICKFEPREYYNVEDVRVAAQLEVTNRAADTSLQPAICIGRGLEPNESYEMVGRALPHPNTQQSTLLISEYATAEDALSTYVAENLEDLQVFQPQRAGGDYTQDEIRTKLNEIYTDLEDNVTRICKRRALHLMIDLAYHSPLFIPFAERTVKGWAEVLIVGDSSQGKSDTVSALQDHYGLGERVECKNATAAGLLGGLQQNGNKWFVSWGVIPTHDKRLVILEELKGTSTEVIGKLTDMRSRGIAELPKIEKRRTHARTRLIAISNARGDKSLSQYNFGIDAIRELIGSLEDVRRFDACLLVAKSEVSAKDITAFLDKQKTPHVFTGDLCRRLVLWGWTRTTDQVVFESERHIANVAAKLSDKYSEMVPIVDRGSMRYKLARLAASLAVRLFSTLDAGGVDSMQTVYVRNSHVDFIANYLQLCYDSETMGYLTYSQAAAMSECLVDPEQVKTEILAIPHAEEVVKGLLGAQEISLQDVQDFTGYTREMAQTMVSVFVRKQAFRRSRSRYVKTSAFIDLLRELQGDSSNFADANLPQHIQEEF